MKRYNTLAPFGRCTIQVHVRHQCPIINAGLRSILSEQPDLEVSDEALGAIRPADNCVMIADYESSVRAVRERGDSVRINEQPVLILTHHDNAGAIRHAMDSGVRGYVIQGGAVSELIEAVRMLNRGGYHLSPKAGRLEAEWLRRTPLTQRETEVLQVLASGSSDKEIARALGIQHATVKSHMKQLFQKLGVCTRTQAVVAAIDLGLRNSPFAMKKDAARGSPPR